jgi:ferritin-like metal-binding protein YciE
MKPLEKVFWDEMGELLHVEELLLKSLPKMKEAATAENLKEALDEYREEVQDCAKRVRDVFQLYEVPPREKKCDAMMGLLTRGQQLMQRSGPGAALDAALVSQTRKIISYKVAAYDGVSDWARQLQAREVAKTLDKSLKVETDSAGEFEEMASDINAEAAKQTEETARKPIVRAPKRPKEFAEGGARWGEF